MFNLWEIIFLFFAFQALLLSIFFFLKKKGDKIANRLLGTYLLLFCCNIIYNVLYWSQLMFTPEKVHLFGLLTNFWILYPPLIYLYTRRIIKHNRFSPKDLIHVIPLVLMISLYFPFYRLSAMEKLQVLTDRRMGDYVFLIKYHYILVLALMIFYTALTYVSFKKHNLDYNKRRWLSWLIGSFACYVGAMMSYFILSRLGLINTGHDYFITYALILFIGLVSYFGFVQPDVFNGLSMDKVLPFKKYKNTGLTANHSLALKSDLLSYMNTEKPYLKPNLQLNDLCEKLNISRHHASQVINEHFDANFYDFINGYRIEESKKLLRSDKNLNITDVIYASGFSNRASFYNTFKKHTGATPTQFKLQKNTG